MVGLIAALAALCNDGCSAAEKVVQAIGLLIANDADNRGLLRVVGVTEGW